MANNEQEFTDFEVQIDLTNTEAWDGESAPPPPEGDYHVRVANVKQEPAKSSQTPMIKVVFEVADGDLAGRKLYGNYNYTNDTGAKRLKSLMVAANMRLDRFSAQELLGAELMVTVQHRIVPGQPDANGNPGKDKTFADVIKERPLEGAAQTQAPAAAAKAPAAAARPPVTNKAQPNGTGARRA